MQSYLFIRINKGIVSPLEVTGSSFAKPIKKLTNLFYIQIMRLSFIVNFYYIIN